MDDDLRARLARMHQNFVGLGEQFTITGRAMHKTVEAMSRLAGMASAHEDWDGKLWPREEGDDADR